MGSRLPLVPHSFHGETFKKNSEGPKVFGKLLGGNKGTGLAISVSGPLVLAAGGPTTGLCWGLAHIQMWLGPPS